MNNRNSKLTAFTLKLSEEDRKTIKMICAIDNSFRYQYQMIDAAVAWAHVQRHNIAALANSKDGDNRSYYVSDSLDNLETLERTWNCNATRALYTAVVSYVKFRKGLFKGSDKLIEE